MEEEQIDDEEEMEDEKEEEEEEEDDEEEEEEESDGIDIFLISARSKEELNSKQNFSKIKYSNEQS